MVSIGGALGASLRYLITNFINSIFISIIPLGTLLVNVLASFLVGFISSIMKEYFYFDEFFIKYFFIIGFLGSFSTFSAFSLETMNMINSGDSIYPILYIFFSILLNILAVFIGMKVI